MIHNQTLRKRNGGFTIVELAVVIITVATLATIGIASHNDTRLRTVKASLKSDLAINSQLIKLSSSLSKTNRYPKDPSSVNDGKGLTLSNDNAYMYNTNGDYARPGYCLVMYNVRYNMVVWIDTTGTRHEITNPNEGTYLCTIGGYLDPRGGNSGIMYGITNTHPLTIGQLDDYSN